ncbi:hypothetical protein LTR27_000702 [Elasticomyces elasticus]|nr:hypothetical protein LTR27_000702 [Elasticomyces elasticus]
MERLCPAAKYNLTDPTLPAYFQVKNLLLIACAEDEWYPAERCRLQAEDTYANAYRRTPKNALEDCAALQELRESLDELAQNQQKAAPKVVYQRLLRYHHAGELEEPDENEDEGEDEDMDMDLEYDDLEGKVDKGQLGGDQEVPVPQIPLPESTSDDPPGSEKATGAEESEARQTELAIRPPLPNFAAPTTASLLRRQDSLRGRGRSGGSARGRGLGRGRGRES